MGILAESKIILDDLSFCTLNPLRICYYFLCTKLQVFRKKISSHRRCEFNEKYLNGKSRADLCVDINDDV